MTAAAAGAPQTVPRRGSWDVERNRPVGPSRDVAWSHGSARDRRADREARPRCGTKSHRSAHRAGSARRPAGRVRPDWTPAVRRLVRTVRPPPRSAGVPRRVPGHIRGPRRNRSAPGVVGPGDSATAPRPPETAMRRTLVPLLAATAAVAAATLPSVSPSVAAEPPLRYVALGDSYSAASGVLPPDPTAPPACLRSTRNYAARHRRADRRTAHRRHLRRRADQGLLHLAVPRCRTAARRAAQRHAAGHHDDRRQRQQRVRQLDRRVRRRRRSPRRARAARARTGTAPRSTTPSAPRPTRRSSRPCRPCTPSRRARGRDPRLPVDPAEDRRLLRQDAGRRPGTCPTCAGSRPRSTTPCAAPPPRPARTYVDLSQVSDGHDACQPIGVRWIEPVAPGHQPGDRAPQRAGRVADGRP